jgi:transcriptional regulator with XRE-family HTH domain
MTGENPAIPAFGRRLATARARHGWSQRELGERAQVSPFILSRIEAGTRGCILLTAVRLAFAAGISLDGLLDSCRHCGGSPPAGFSCSCSGAKETS